MAFCFRARWRKAITRTSPTSETGGPMPRPPGTDRFRAEAGHAPRSREFPSLRCAAASISRTRHHFHQHAVEAAIDEHLRSVDVTGAIACEEQGSLRDVVRLADAAGRDHGFALFL